MRRWLAFFVSLLIVSFIIPLVDAFPGLAQSEAELPQLGIRPAGTEGTYFSITLNAGESEELTVELGNFGKQPIRARTYAADVYTLINGGFGVKSATDPVSGATTWLDYTTTELNLEPGQRVQRAFSVVVPPDTPPGEYLTSLVIENADPVAIGNGEGNVQFNQIIRQAIAVAIDVPGPRQARLEILSARYEVLPAYARLLVDIRNSGNLRVRPSGKIFLYKNGEEIAQYPISLDSVYAGTETAIEVMLVKALSPGEYTVSVVLQDKKHKLKVKSEPVPLTVAAMDDSGTPQGVEITSFTVEEQRAPGSNVLQFADLTIAIDNLGMPVSNAQLTLHVTRDGQPLEDVVLGSSLSFPSGVAEFRQRYVPVEGWVPGTYAFTVSIEVIDPETRRATMLATAEASTPVIVK
jgi:hypothetical protein